MNKKLKLKNHLKETIKTDFSPKKIRSNLMLKSRQTLNSSIESDLIQRMSTLQSQDRNNALDKIASNYN